MPMLSSFFFLSFLFLLPFNIKFPIYLSSFSLVTSDYTTFFFYPIEILLILAFLFFPKKISSPGATSWWIILSLLTFIPAFFIGKDTTLSLLFLIRIAEAGILIYLIRHHITTRTSTIATLGVSMLIQSGLAITQYFFQHSLGLGVLGESFFTHGVINTASITLGATTIMRGYGTFAHPNIFACFALLTTMFFLIYKQEMIEYITKKWWAIILFLCLVGLFLTFSRSAVIGLILGFVALYFFTKRKRTIIVTLIMSTLLILALSFIIPIFGTRFFAAQTEDIARLQQYKTSISIIPSHIFGTGINNYTLFQENETTVPLTVWDVQPVHNTLMHFLLEWGIIPFIILFTWSIYFILQLARSPQRILLTLIIVLIPFLLTDHFFLTSFPGWILFLFVIGMIGQQIKRGI